MLRMLIASGAMDRLAHNRASMDAVIAQLQKKAREIEEIQGGPGQATLFDMDEWEDGEEPASAAPEPDLEEWNDWDRHQREAEALGFHLTMDPVRRFHIALDRLRPFHMEELTPRLAGRTVRLVGLVVSVEDDGPLLREPGSRIVNLEGLPVFLSPHLAALSAEALEPATEALVIGKMERDGGSIRLVAEGVWRLEDMEDQATKVTRLRLRLAGENHATLKLLLALAKQFPGNTALDLTDYPLGHGWTYRRLARRKVFFCSPLYQGLSKILSAGAIDLFGAAGEPLEVRLPAAAEEAAGEEGALEEELAEEGQETLAGARAEDDGADGEDDGDEPATAEGSADETGEPAQEETDADDGAERGGEESEETARSASEAEPRVDG
jgi:hypothetical protein